MVKIRVGLGSPFSYITRLLIGLTHVFGSVYIFVYIFIINIQSMIKLWAVLSNGKDKLTVLMDDNKRRAYNAARTNLFNRGEVGRYLAIIVLIIGAFFLIISLL